MPEITTPTGAPVTPATPPKPSVLVHQGHHADGSLRPAAARVIDWPDPEQVWDPKKQPHTVFIGGEPHVQIGQTADGSKVYAHEDVKKR